MNNNTDGIEQRLREEADRFLGQSPARDLVRTLQAHRQRRELKRVASVAAISSLRSAVVWYSVVIR